MQGGYKAAAMSGVKSAAPAPPASNGSGANSANAANANGAKKTNTKKKPATTDKGNGKPPGLDEAPAAAGRAPPPGFAKPAGAAAVPNAWASPLPAVANAAPVGFSDSQQRLLRHRALFVFRFLVGKAVEVTLVDQSRYVGILDCVDPDDFSVVLKNTQRKGDQDAEFDSGSTVIFKRRQLAHMAAEGVVNYTESAPALSRGPSAGAAPGFRTDTEISNRSHEHLFGRELESASSWLDPQLDTGDLEEPARRKGAGWNQFEANEKLFGVVSTFDENLYTTKLDKTKFSTEKSREAERLAREIERETTGNFHLQEERGQAVHGGDDLDEEAKYSSVDRKQQSSPASRGPNAYVPPALRNASRPTSAGPTKQKPISPKTQAPAKAPPAAAAPPVTGTTAPAVAPPAKTTTTATAPATTATATPAAVPATAPASTTVTPPAEPSPATPTPAAAADAAAQPRKPISFSEAVTGRPTARPSPTLAPAAAPTSAPAASTSKAPAKQERKASTSPKKQPSPKSEKPAKATSPPATKKEAKAAPAKNQSEKKVASEKKSAETKAGEESKAEKKSKSAKTDSSKQAAAATATPTQAAPTPDATSTPAAAAPAAKKTTLNPKAKEFKLSASAATFTPKFAAPAAAPVTSSPYRQPNAAPYGHMHPPPPHPAMGGMGYPPAPEEWMYDGMMVDESEYAAAAAHAYMGYGMPMMPNPAMMQQPMYAPMMPPQQNVRMGRGGAAGYGYNQPGMYNPRGYYGQGAAPGAVPYHGAPGAVPGMPQPPLPPTPAETAGPVETPASPSLAPSPAPPAGTGAQRPASNSKNADATSKK